MNITAHFMGLILYLEQKTTALEDCQFRFYLVNWKKEYCLPGQPDENLKSNAEAQPKVTWNCCWQLESIDSKEHAAVQQFYCNDLVWPAICNWYQSKGHWKLTGSQGRDSQIFWLNTLSWKGRKAIHILGFPAFNYPRCNTAVYCLWF